MRPHSAPGAGVGVGRPLHSAAAYDVTLRDWTLTRLRWTTLVPLVAGTFVFAFDRVRPWVRGGGTTLRRWWPWFTLFAGHVMLAAMLAALAAISWIVAGRIAKERRFARLVLAGGIMAACGAAPALWVGQQLTGGGWISEQWFAPAVAMMPLGMLVVGAPVAVHFGFSAPPTTSRGRRLTLALLAGATLVCAAADLKVGVGLYPEFHLTLHVCIVSSAMLLVRHLLLAREEKVRPVVRQRLAVAALVVCVASPVAWFAMSTPTRSALSLASPMAADWLRQVKHQRTALLRDMLADLDVREGRYAPAATGLERGLIDGREYNVLLIVVDALRADALQPARPEEGNAFSRPEETPNLDAWLSTTYRFRNTYSIATKTHLAMPGLFRSVEVGDDAVTMGRPLALRMEELGRAPTAVAVDYFLSPKTKSVAALVEGFGDMAFYEKKYNEQAVPALLEKLRELQQTRFFLWLHMYNVHDPGFDGTLLGSGDCGRVECYRRSMAYLDVEFGKITAELDALGLRDNTIVVLVADHGEGLGDHGLMLHGPNVYDEDVRVPLAIAIPGHTGGIIEETVGSIDVAPTLVDLLGGELEPQDRGRSLVPLMAGAEATGTRPYYFRNQDGKVTGLVSGRDKLIFDSEAAVIHRFDLEADPDEMDDVFDPEGEKDRELLRTFVGFNPGIVAEELADPANTELLAARLSEIDPEAPGAAMPLLIKLVDFKPDKPLVNQTVDLFKATTDGPTRLLILRHLYDAAPKRFGQAVNKWIEAAAKSGEELEIVDDLVAQGQAEVAGKTIPDRVMHHANTGEPAAWASYLRLIRPWRRTGTTYQPALSKMLERANASKTVPASVIELILDSVATLGGDIKSRKPLESTVRPFLDHPEGGVRAMAIRALGGLKAKDDVERVRAILRDLEQDPRVRREAASALVAMAGEDAIDELIAATNTASMEVIVVRELTKLGSKKALPYLREIAKSHYNSYLRREATRSVAKIEGRGSKKPARPTQPKPAPKPKAKPEPEP